jgi:hypothetical protein
MKSTFLAHAVLALTIFGLAPCASAQDTTKTTGPGATLSEPKNAIYGSDETQRKAIPHYDEALHLIEKGRIDEAMRELHEAIEISNDLVEAELLLGDLYLEKKDYGNAFKYWNMGVDFNIKQERSWYNKLFYYGMRLGEYEIVWQNAKHYKKLYGAGEIDYVMNSQILVSHYKSWYGEWTVKPLELPVASSSVYMDGSTVVMNGIEGRPALGKMKKGKISGQKAVGKTEIYDLHLSGDQAFYAVRKDTLWQLCEGKLIDGKVAGDKILQGIGHCRYPYYDADQAVLFFSRMVNGQWDIYYVKSMGDGMWSDPIALDKVNTAGNEISFTKDKATGHVYVSSDGWPGFGGYDVFVCKDNETERGATLPMNPKNLLYPVNSNLDELYIHFYDTDKAWVMKQDLWKKNYPMAVEKSAIRFWQGDRYKPTEERW